ncbi:MAG: hypothetical protein HY226_02780 [Candidatus Vogelbacteria bacterium]|nr:hypothetical protein [Candidatus Vogelbacteria bacterium]
MSFTLILLIVTIFSNLILAVFVYKNNPQSATNKIFSTIAVITALWLSAMYLAQSQELLILNLFFIRLTTFFAAPMALSFYLFAYTLPSQTITLSENKLYFIIGVTLVAMVLALSPFVFTDIKIQNGVSSPVAGWALAVYGVIAISLSLGSIYGFIRRAARSNISTTERQQLTFVLIGGLLMWGLIIGTIFLPVLLFNSDFFVPFAPVYVLLFLGMAAYAIIKHRFLDVRLILYRAVSLLLADVVLAFAYSLVIFIVLYNIYSVFDLTFFLILAFSMTSIAVLTFDYIEKSVRTLTDRLFFKGEYDRDALLSSLTNTMVGTIELEVLTDKILRIMRSGMRLAGGAFLIIENHKIVDIKGTNYRLLSDDMHELEALFHGTADGKKYFIFEDQHEGSLKDVLRRLNIYFVIPIRVDNNEVAILLLGPKMSGEVYYDRDIRLLEIFASEAGIAIENAKSYTKLKNFNKDLEQKVVERTGQLKKSQANELEKARALVKLKDEFVFIAAHELRAPITAIRGFLDLALGSNVKFPKDVDEDLHSVVSASDHLNALVNDLLEIARAESQTIKIEVTPVDIGATAENVMNELSPLATQRNIKVKLSNNSHDLLALADTQKTKEVLTNLIGNGIKYNRDEGVLTVKISELDSYLKIEVEDTGFGIPKEDQDKIFQKFFRSINDHTKHLFGTGLGLFITKMLVEKMSGTISFKSTEGEGTTFTVLLPKV